MSTLQHSQMFALAHLAVERPDDAGFLAKLASKASKKALSLPPKKGSGSFDHILPADPEKVAEGRMELPPSDRE